MIAGFQPAPYEQHEMHSNSVAVLGCGYWGKNLVRNFHELGRLAMVCDEAADGRTLAQLIVPGIPVRSSLQDVIDAGIRNIVIATPANVRTALIRINDLLEDC